MCHCLKPKEILKVVVCFKQSFSYRIGQKVKQELAWSFTNLSYKKIVPSIAKPWSNLGKTCSVL